MARLSRDGLDEVLETTETRRSFDVWNEVPLVAQTTGMSCWAAAAAMLVGWRERLAVDPDDVARGAGRWSEFKNGLHPEDVGAFAERWGLVMEDADDVWDVDRFRALLESYGPLWVGEASPGLHAIVVTGIYGDGTPEGTRVRVNDPWPVGGGERYTITFRQLRENFDAASRLTGDRAHILHSGGRARGTSGHWRSEERVMSRVARTQTIGDAMNKYGRATLIDVEALDVRAGDRYIDTTRIAADPLAGHGGTGENLYLTWNLIPDTASAVDVVVHLHGYSPLDANRAMLEKKVAASGLDLTGRTRPTLAILPRGRKITQAELRAERQAGRQPNTSRYTFPALTAQQGSGLERLIQYALAFLGRDVLGGRTVTPARLIITVHSGAGKALDDLLQHYTVRAACNPHEVHIYDALYWPSPNIATWVRSHVSADTAFLGKPGSEDVVARDGGGCRVIYGPGTQANSLELARVFPASGPLRGAYRAESTRVVHGDIPRVFGRALLTSVRADLVVVPARARAQATVEPLDFDESIGLAADDDARAWLTADETTRGGIAPSVRSWVLATDRSAIELLPDAARRRHFLTEVNWQHQDFPGRGSRTTDTEALFAAMQRVVPERRVPGTIRYHNVDSVVVAVPGNGSAKLFPEAKDAFVRMREAAQADGVTLTILSAWRSQATQQRIKSGNTNPNAVAQGVSSHTYGLAIDLALTVPNLRATEISTASMPNMVAMYRSPIYKWMALNGRRFGWFPYRREPWHWEYNPEGFKTRYESGGRTGGALTYGAPTGLFDVYAPTESLDVPAPAKGRAIPRARVSDPLGNKILDLLWEPIAEDDVPRMRDRLRRFDAEIDRLSDDQACALLPRLMPKGDLKRDFDYRFSRGTRQRIRRKLRARCQSVPPPRPPDDTTPEWRDWSGPKRVVKPPTPAPIPKPVPRPGFKVVAVYKRKSQRDRRIKKFKYWGLFLQWEVEATISVNATDTEFATIKAQWEHGEYKPEFNAEFDSMFTPDVKVETEKKDGKTKFVLSFKKSVSAGPVTISPHWKWDFWEPVNVELELPKLISWSPTFKGQKFEVSFTPKAIVVVRLDWGEMLREVVKEGVESFLDRLKKSLLSLFGDLLAWRFKAVLGALLGAVLARLLIDPDETEPIEVEPADVYGFDDALAYANAGRTTPMPDDRFEHAATDHRRTYAKGFGDTMAELTRPTWRARLEDLRHARQVRSFFRLPAAKTDRDWIAWSLSAGKHGLESVDLYADDFVTRYRKSEKAFLFAVAVHARGKLNQEELNEARQTAKQQATVAGMAAAVQHVTRTIAQQSVEFLDENGAIRRSDGHDAWQAVAEIVQKSRIPHAVVQDRLAQLAVEHLPVLKI